MNVVLGVSGSVAAYRAADLARELMRHGCEVRVCLTDSAQHFVTPALFEALTGKPTLQGAFEEPERGRMAHIDWARHADLLLVAPATASTLGRLAHGVADDMLTTIALAYTGPVLLAPSMNPAMYLHEATQASLEILQRRGAFVVEPLEGEVACGEHGQGKLASVSDIVSAAMELLHVRKKLSGKKILITSGPTQEPIDSARYLTNRSSGKMGSALARAALLLGAEVTVVSGPTKQPMPFGATVFNVRTAEEMLAVAEPLAANSDWIIAAAAVSDYRPAVRVEGKIRRSDEALRIELIPNPDIVASLAHAAPKALVVGFAAEPSSDLEESRQKLVRKGLAAIAVNDISKSGIGFDADENEITLVWADGREASSGQKSKLSCAIWLLEQLIQA